MPCNIPCSPFTVVLRHKGREWDENQGNNESWLHSQWAGGRVVIVLHAWAWNTICRKQPDVYECKFMLLQTTIILGCGNEGWREVDHKWKWRLSIEAKWCWFPWSTKMLSSNLYSFQLPRCRNFISFSIRSQGHPDMCLQAELCNLRIVCILMMPGQLWRLSELPRCKHQGTASKRCLRLSQNNKGSNLLEGTRLSGGVGGILEGADSFLVLSGAGTVGVFWILLRGWAAPWQRNQWGIRGGKAGGWGRPGDTQAASLSWA